MSLALFLRAGGIHRDVSPTEVPGLLERAVRAIPGADEAAVGALVDRVRAPGGVSWAPVGDGLALPHLRASAPLGSGSGVIAILFLRDAITTAGPPPDGVPVSRLLFFVAPTPTAHLQMLGRLSAAILRGDLRRAMLDAASDEAIVAAIERATPFR